jgi:hypothetical protein
LRIKIVPIRAIANNSVGIDIYRWPAHYLPPLSARHQQGLYALHAQFGASYLQSDHLRARFSEHLSGRCGQVCQDNVAASINRSNSARRVSGRLCSRSIIALRSAGRPC